MNRHSLPQWFSAVLCFALILSGLAAAEDVRGDGPATNIHRLVTQTPQDLQQLLRYSGEALPMVSAHRGGSQRAFPENCLATFTETLRHTFAMLEVDPRITKDGQIVVLHDATLERTTTGMGRVADHTAAELQGLRLRDSEGQVTPHGIPTLDEVFQWARGKTILVLDQKDVPLQVRVEKIQQHQAESFVILIVYSFADAQQVHALDPQIMMEVMIPDQQQLRRFDRSGVPWSNVVAFVGHTPPQDKELLRMIHARGACCIAGTSRNLDRQLAAPDGPGGSMAQHYRGLLETGVDLIETDVPRQLARLLYEDSPVPASKARFFLPPSP